VLKEYERINGKIKPICKNLLVPHIADIELKLHPGMSTLTWTSMKIDSYLAHVHQGLKKLEQLIINVNDIAEYRIENNLKNISNVSLVSLPMKTSPSPGDICEHSGGMHQWETQLPHQQEPLNRVFSRRFAAHHQLSSGSPYQSCEVRRGETH
jgi:hypothetical protein